MRRTQWGASLATLGLSVLATTLFAQSPPPAPIPATPVAAPAVGVVMPPLAPPSIPPAPPAGDVLLAPVVPTARQKPATLPVAAGPSLSTPTPPPAGSVVTVPVTILGTPPAPALVSSPVGQTLPMSSGDSLPPNTGISETKKDGGSDTAKPAETSDPKGLTDSLHQDDCYGLKSLFDSLHPVGAKGKHWYEKLSLRGYTQFRFGRTVHLDEGSAAPNLFGDRSINGTAENFSIRRARLILFGDVSDYLSLYFQTDSAVTPPGSSTSSYFTQLRDLYGDVYFDTDKVHRLRIGMSKVPYGWENLQSSQNRVPLDRSNPINSAVPNERDLGVFYYWTPEDKQKLFKDLVDGGLKGSGNYGIFGFGVYNGQASHHLEMNRNLHAVARFTWPFLLDDGQVVEASLQGYTGEFVVQGDEIRALGVGDEFVPAGTREDDHRGHLDQRVAASFIWYPQPFGLQAEWNVGRGPGLNDAQTAVVQRSLHGGYLMAMYKVDTGTHGIVTPFARCQYYRGGYKSIANAPYGTHREFDLGVEWQIRKEMELVVEYAIVDGFNPTAVGDAGVVPYRDFEGSVLRVQFQINY